MMRSQIVSITVEVGSRSGEAKILVKRIVEGKVGSNDNMNRLNRRRADFPSTAGVLDLVLTASKFGRRNV